MPEKFEVLENDGIWYPCEFLGILYGKDNLIVVRLEAGGLFVYAYHTSRVRKAKVD